ncbi:sigma-w pathway protein ysdB [Lederbergia citrea]|uniref:Sigma-w pathway protein ysdB n=1 Tax=Lederbergia citrea TaxID=2833581 RepID=A0A942UPI1_9BACI|nr:sigma-w pathway protein ysdB [Lederbergia citrea]MBS4176086.1 sigma-w pathway protein ysdB [Lederbergia citrea]MBS4202647.1 sigma-w pathway protein ysdB [Lederbergia citrea]MBS4222686.1 sigma-w pathway protein ysdB [Lederbergia citrea]
MIILLRVVIFAFIIYLIYKTVKFILDPKRKLEAAHEQRKYYFYDTHENIRKNFLITYNGVMFEGEKYLGTTDRSFEVVSIFVWPRNTDLLQGLSYEDFVFIENEIKLRYPDAEIDWKSPIKELLKKNRN